MSDKIDNIIAVWEDLSYDQLFRMSEPRRVKRSDTVVTPPMDMTADENDMYYMFNFKGKPSTTGLRQHGYIRFKKPRHHNPDTPLSQIPVDVDCTCPDYKYRWAWANKQRGAGKVGAGSLNQSLNRAPRRTNPASRPGLCKHILAAKDFFYGIMSEFPSDEDGLNVDKLDKLVSRADRRWNNYDQEVELAKQRSAKMKAATARRRIGAPGIPLADYDSTKTAAELPDVDELLPSVPDTEEEMGYLPGEERPFNESFDTNPESADVVISSMKTMLSESTHSKLRDSLTIIKEMEEVEDVDLSADTSDMAPPPQPPVSDSALDVDTESNTALGLLGEIRDLLQQQIDIAAGGPEDDEELDGEGMDEEIDYETEVEHGAPVPPMGGRPLPVQTGA